MKTTMWLSGIVVGLATVLLGLFATQANAEVIIDVRAVSGSGGVTVTDAKDVIVSAAGQVVHFEVYARILGADGILTNDGFQSTMLSFLETRDSSLWEARGNMSNPSRVAPFNASGSQDGHALDLNADGDADIGRIYGSGSGVSSDTYVPRSGSLTYNTTSTDQLFGRFDWTVSAVQTGGTVPTTINALPYITTSGSVLYTVDGVFHSQGWAAMTPPGGPGLAVSITVATPEPGTLTLLAAGLVGLLACAWRRRR
jgi:hypothetical protein